MSDEQKTEKEPVTFDAMIAKATKAMQGLSAMIAAYAVEMSEAEQYKKRQQEKELEDLEFKTAQLCAMRNMREMQEKEYAGLSLHRIRWEAEQKKHNAAIEQILKDGLREVAVAISMASRRV